MATAEFIQKRIDGKLKEIATFEKKIARIEKAKATNWEKNPYYYSERDLVSALKDKEIAEKALARYQSDLEKASNKAASRNIPAITEFLNQWELKVTEYFLQEKDRFDVAYNELRKKDSELVNKFNSSRDREERNAAHKENIRIHKEFKDRWSHILQFNHGTKGWEQTMMEDIAKEKDRKYDDLIERIVPITGQITDASNLYVGPSGDLNGWIDGLDGSAEVRTIGAGGYNQDVILDSGRHGQIYHYRTLVNKIK